MELARAALERTQEALGVLLAEDASIDADPQVSLAEPPSLNAALQEVLGLRADVLAQKSRVETAHAVRRDTWTEYLPALSGVFQPFVQDPASFTTPDKGWTAQLLLTWTLYDGGLRFGEYAERRALEEQAKLALDGTQRQTLSEVRTSYEMLARSDAAFAAATRSANLARLALDLANQSYKAGATTNLDVIDAERRARDAETTAAAAEDFAWQARLDVLAAAGRFP